MNLQTKAVSPSKSMKKLVGRQKVAEGCIRDLNGFNSLDFTQKN